MDEERKQRIAELLPKYRKFSFEDLADIAAQYEVENDRLNRETIDLYNDISGLRQARKDLEKQLAGVRQQVDALRERNRELQRQVDELKQIDVTDTVYRCAWCGKEMHHADEGRKKQFCSASCRAKAWRADRKKSESER